MTNGSGRNLHLICVGGTGARVARAFVHLLACGIKPPVSNVNIYTIDPDAQNGDQQNLANTCQHYRTLHKMTKDINGNTKLGIQLSMFATPLNYFSYAIAGKGKVKFKDYVGYTGTGGGWQNLFECMYTHAQMENDLSAGFRGNPHMGSVVLANELNQFITGTLKRQVGGANDRIVVVGSLFGGTGAAGCPVLLRLLRQNSDTQNLWIAFIAMLPYYAVQSKPDDGDTIVIRSSEFRDKALLALKTYQQDFTNPVSGVGRMLCDYLYRIGLPDLTQANLKPYGYCDGGEKQRNPASVTELIAATAILHFLNDVTTVGAPTGNSATEPRMPDFFADPNVFDSGTIKDFGEIQWVYNGHSIWVPLRHMAYRWAFLRPGAVDKHQNWFSDNECTSAREHEDVESVWYTLLAQHAEAPPGFGSGGFANVALGQYLDLFGEWLCEMMTASVPVLRDSTLWNNVFTTHKQGACNTVSGELQNLSGTLKKPNPLLEELAKQGTNPGEKLQYILLYQMEKAVQTLP